MVKERILVTVRTYPAISAKYSEVVCTGGITEDGEWRRLVPVPLRLLEKEKQYRTFDVIEVAVGRGKDGRPETRTPQLSTLRVIGPLTDWRARCEWVNPTIFSSLEAMADAGKTLAPVAVDDVLEFVAKPVTPEWSPAQREKLRQQHMFGDSPPPEKIPFSFRFRWRDLEGAEHNSLFMAWEVGQTWREYRKRYDDPIRVMRDKWMNDLCGPQRKVSFFMGNLASRRWVFCVCGVFGPPREVAESGTLWSGV